MKVYKYPVIYPVIQYPGVPAAVTLPIGARVLCSGVQAGIFVIWAEVPEGTGAEERVFSFLPTGGTVPPGATYINTVFTGEFVWHCYELPQ